MWFPVEIGCSLTPALGGRFAENLFTAIWLARSRACCRVISRSTQILNGANFGEFDPKALGARVALLKWIQSRIPEMNVTNLGGDWRDGRCLSALVNCIASDFKMPEQIANPMDLPKDKAIGNLDNAMEIAANTLGIGRLLTPEQVRWLCFAITCSVLSTLPHPPLAMSTLLTYCRPHDSPAPPYPHTRNLTGVSWGVRVGGRRWP
jgi:hypothetical protein